MRLCKNITRCARATNKVRRSWSAKEKLIVIYYLERTNNVRATAKRFDIEPKQVPQYPLLEEKLVEWIKELRNMHNAITRNMVRCRYNEWMINAIHDLTPAERIRKPSYSTLALWVKESWDEISPLLIRKAFKCY
ncbi:46520_t:CDS:2, partial [Gigaspora margarita]